MKILAPSETMEKPTIITDVPCQHENKSSDKKMTTVKYTVLGVVVVCVTVAIVAGFLFAFKFHTESTTDIIKRTFNVEGQKETIEENKKENTKLFKMEAGGETQYVLYDFNRRLRLVKTHGTCFVNAMNATLNDIESYGGDPDSKYMYKSYSKPVVDDSFLAQEGQKLCHDVELYWTFPECVEAGEDDNQPISNETEEDRQKRQIKQLFFCNIPQVSGGWCSLRACDKTVKGVYPCKRLYLVRWIWSSGLHQCGWFATGC